MNNPFSKSLKTTLVILFVTISIVSIVILAVSSFNIAQSSLRERIDAQLQNEAKYRSEIIKNIWNLKIEQLTLLASTDPIRTILNKPVLDSTSGESQAITKITSSFLRGTDFYDLKIIDKGGRVAYANNTESVGEDLSLDNNFKNGMRESFYSLTRDYDTGKAVMIISVPVFNDIENNSEVIGVVQAKRDLTPENKITTDRANLGKSGETYLVNQGMYMITDSRFIQNAPFNVKVNTLPVKECFERGLDFSSVFTDYRTIPQEFRQPVEGKGGIAYPDYREVPVFGASHCEKSTGFVLLAEMDESEIYAPITQLRDQYVIIGAAIVFVVGIISFFVSSSISKPIVKLTNIAERISKGDLDIHIENTNTKNEVGRLSHSFKTMIFNLGELIRQVQDLNQQLRLTNKELKMRDKMKDEFISIASHELKNPVQPILGFAYLAKKGKIPHDEAWDGVLEHARRLKRLATDILDVSKIESGSLNYKMEKIRINQVIREVVDSLRINLQKGVLMETNLDRSDIEIRADKERIIQMLGNIIENAIKFTKQGTIRVSSQERPDLNKIEITISDTGGGIDYDILPKLFGKFVTMSVKEGMEHGTGLGLFIAREIVTSHGGEINAYNNNEGGATFKVTLPINP
jgi:signal transduction histidine kinase